MFLYRFRFFLLITFWSIVVVIRDFGEIKPEIQDGGLR